MKKTSLSRLLAAGSFLFLGLSAGALRGQTFDISINPQSISFAAADPDTSPQVAADRAVQVQVHVAGNRAWRLTLRANGNLSDFWSLATIDVSNISWTATSSPPFQNGTLASNVEQVAASLNGNFNGHGDLNFVFQNRWTYWAGAYSQTVTFTLSAI